MLPQINNPTGKIYVNPNFNGQHRPQQTADMMESLVVRPPHIPVSTHINPLFLEKQHRSCGPTIHMNPMFLLKLHEQQQHKYMISETTTLVSNPATCPVVIPQPEIPAAEANELVVSSATTGMKTYPVEHRKIICKSKNRLIREPLRLSSLQRASPTKSPMTQPQPLLMVNKRKLVRKPIVPVQNLNINAIKPHTAPISRPANKTKYKLDNRVIRKKAHLSFSTKTKRKSFVGRYALRRTSSSQILSKQTVIKSSMSQSKNKKLQLLSINGLLYKSTRNKLQLKDASERPANIISKPNKFATTPETKPSQGLTIFVRGTKYIMDPQKFKLTRVTSTDKGLVTNVLNKSPLRSRIDIGGFTYVSAPYAKNVLIRTTNHLARAYVHNAKQKSVHVLTKHLVKSNIPCPIYQRVGKCAAFERGKCSYVHNKLQVAICSKFLRGECLNTKCLLSHDVSLSKMPVCKFFLQGVCVRNDCPYLHKKLSNNAEVCIEFLRGFCKLADKCNKRHEFVCPELERNGSCTRKTCIYCKTRLKKEHLSKRLQNKETNNKVAIKKDDITTKMPTVVAKETSEKPTGNRYFIGSPAEEAKLDFIIEEEGVMVEDSVDDDINEDLSRTEEIGVKKRPKLGVLPAFIPLS